MADGATTPAATLTKTDDGYLLAAWAGALNGLATGGKVSMPRIRAGSMAVQVTGTFGSATAVLQGSVDGTNFTTCYAKQQNTVAGKNDPCSFTAAGLMNVLDDGYRYYRMSTSGGTGSAVIMSLVAQRN